MYCMLFSKMCCVYITCNKKHISVTDLVISVYKYM